MSGSLLWGTRHRIRTGSSRTVPPMSQLILAIHPGGQHDSAAAVRVDYDVKAAVQLERLTRIKGDGGDTDPCVEEVLSIVGARRRDVDVLVLSRSDFPVRYFTHF